jgi:hypothetical protein
MHHIALCTHALDILISPHVYAYTVDHAEPGSEVQAE